MFERVVLQLTEFGRVCIYVSDVSDCPPFLPLNRSFSNFMFGTIDAARSVENELQSRQAVKIAYEGLMFPEFQKSYLSFAECFRLHFET